VIVIGGPFCPLCRRLEEHTLKDTRVVARLAAFEVLHIDIEADSAAAADLDVHAVPDIWALNGAGRVLARHNGFLDAEAFLAFLDRIRKR
jgi:thioredoxin-like negative regulator of GroEL